MAVAHPQSRHRDLADRLEPYRDDFDRITADASSRAPLSHPDYDRLEERIEVFCRGVRAVVRGARR